MLILWSLLVTETFQVMPRIANIEPYKDPNRVKPWRVDVPASISPTGKRQRFYFETKQRALNFCEEQRIRLKNFGVTGLEIIKPAQLEQAANAFQLLEPYDVTLNEVVNEWISRRRASEASIPFEAAMDAFMEWGKRSPSYTRSIRQTRNRLESLHGRLLNTITPADLTLAMDAMPGSVRNFTIRILGGLFNFGIKRCYCADNPCKKLDLFRREAVEIQIHTPTEVSAILSAAENHDPELVPFLAVSFFCGVRRSEALRLDWSSVDLYENFVKLPAAITKTKQGRHIEISENCKAWLSSHMLDAGRVTPCTPDILRKRVVALKEVHQVTTIKHGSRHCFASYWLSMHGNINQLCQFLGHDDPETTFKHYAKAATKRDAEKFWAVMPKTAKARNVVSFQRQEATA
jgi:integrase/recombinase XerD